MNNQIRCEQFVFGKFIGPKNASFEIIASSSGISEDEAWLIRKTFEDCLPRSTNIETYKTVYAAAPISDNRVALLRLARSKDKQIDRDYFLDEHYIILNCDTLKNAHTRLWLWLNSIPEAKSISKFEKLPDSMTLNESIVSVQIQKALENLAQPSQGYFRESLLSSVYYLLNSQSVGLVLDKSPFDERIWVAALSLLLPTLQTMNLRLFWGSEPPAAWMANLSLSSNIPQLSTGRILNPSANTNNILSLSEMKKGYSSLSWRCLESHDLRLFNELIDMAENVKIWDQLEKSKTPLDLLLWLETMPKVGLKLATKEVSHKDVSLSDLQWLWRNANESFAPKDVEFFLPSLLKKTIDEWGEDDNKSFSKILNRSPGIVSVIVNKIDDEELIYKFLSKWTESSSNFSENDLSLYESFLMKLARNQVENTIELLLLWFPSGKRDDVVRVVSSVLQAIPNNITVSEKQSWELIFSLFRKIENKSDLKRYLKIIQKIQFPREFQIVVDLSLELSKGAEYEVYIKNLREFFLLAKRSNLISQGVVSLFTCFLSIKDANAFFALAFIVSKLSEDLLVGINLDIRRFEEGKEWVNNFKDARLLGAFLLLTGRLINRNLSAEMLTLLLKDDPDLFGPVISIMLTFLKAQRADLRISWELLSDTTNNEQLALMFEYILSTQILGKSNPELEKIDVLLNSVKSLDGISARILAPFANYSPSRGTLGISQKILQHQLRTAILRHENRQIHESFERLQKTLGTRKSNSLKNKIIKSYFRSLPPDKKRSFSSWLLESPLGEFPALELSPSQPLTSYMLDIKPAWFIEDLSIRLILYQEVFMELYNTKSKSPKKKNNHQ